MTIESSKSKLRSLLPLVWAGLFMLCGIMVLVYLGRDTARLMNGPLGEIELIPILEATDRLTTESLAGRVAVLHFWGTWCPPCRLEFPEFVELQQKLATNPKVAVVCISCSSGLERDLDGLRTETADYLKMLNVSMPMYADPNMFTRASITRMLAAGGFGYPLTMVVDQQGIVRDYWLGYRKGSMEKAVKLVEQLVAAGVSSNQTP